MSQKQKVYTTPIGRLSYPYLFEKSELSDQFAATLIFDEGTDLAELEAEIERAADEKWGKGKWPSNFQHPVHDNSEKEDVAGYTNPGSYTSFKRKTRPKVVANEKDPSTGDLREITPESGEAYAGCYVRVSYHAYAWSNAKFKSNGVSLQLHNVQKMSEGEPLGGALSDPNEDFDVDSAVEDALG